ncbi:MAG: DNA-protecting protein DprA [Sphaerochaetaceae bacterium]|nr:DNA-protecting protein DprA [Sphaerochaetaceae bacterium]
MNNRDFAVNYNAVLLATSKADSFCMNAFEKAEILAGKSVMTKPVYELPEVWNNILGTDTASLVKAWDRSARSMDNLPKDTIILCRGDLMWPADVTDVPVLYLRGHVEFLNQDGVCVVGTRIPSNQGAFWTKEAVKSLDKNFVIISGLAMGVDGIAHIQALSDNQKTIGVIGTPIGEYYPAQHKKLQDAIAEHGLLVSRFAPCLTMQKYFFMLRNLLMSQIGRASFVIESRDGGGGVTQASYSEKQGKPVLVFKETYENRTYMWPRKLKDPVLVSSPERSCETLRKALGLSGSAATRRKTEEDIQPLLF